MDASDPAAAVEPGRRYGAHPSPTHLPATFDVAGAWELNQVFSFAEGDVGWRPLGDHGAPIVLAHGTPYSSLLWRDIAPALAHSRRVFVLDHLGCGQSAHRPRDRS